MPSKTKVLVVHGLSSKPSPRRLKGEIVSCLDCLRPDQVTILYWADLAGYEHDNTDWSDPNRHKASGIWEHIRRKCFGTVRQITRASVEHSIAIALGLDPISVCGATCFIPPTWFAAPLEHKSRQLFGEQLSEMSNYFCEGSELRRGIVRRALRLSQCDVAIGHSMGSVILVDLLMAEIIPAVKHLITIGSPLGLGVVRHALSKYYPPSRPLAECFSGEWLNVSDPLDIISLDATLSGEYDCNVRDVYIENDALTPEGKRHYHSLFGYLRSEPVQQLLRRSL